METIILLAALALCLFSLGALLRNDWLRLTQPRRQVVGRVTGHHMSRHKAASTYAPVYAFSDESGTHEVIDQVYIARPDPPVGTCLALTYPRGRPDLARPPRALVWWAVYGFLIYGTGVIAAKLAGLI